MENLLFLCGVGRTEKRRLHTISSGFPRNSYRQKDKFLCIVCPKKVLEYSQGCNGVELVLEV